MLSCALYRRPVHAIAAAILLFVAVTVSNTGGTDAHFGSITNSGRCGAVTQDISAPFLLGTVAYAAETSGGDSGALVPCGNNIEVKEEGGKICTYNECSICHTSILAQRVLRFMVGIGSILCALLFVYAGGLYVFSGTKPGNVSKAHKVFTNALIGLVLVLAAWLIVDLLIKSFAKTSISGAWTTLLCDGASSKHCVDKLSAIEVNVEQTSGTSCEVVYGGDCTSPGGCKTYGKDREITGTSCSGRSDGKTSCCASYKSQESCDLGGGKKGTCQTTVTCASGTKVSPCSDAGLVCCNVEAVVKKCSDYPGGGGCVFRSSQCVASPGSSDKFEIVTETTDCNSNTGDTLCCRKVTTSGSDSGTSGYSTNKIKTTEARTKLNANGVTIASTMSNGTGDGVQQGVIDDTIQLKKDCSCSIIVTSLDGGHTTGGHVAGTKSDYDNLSSLQLNSYIESWDHLANRTSDNAPQYYNSTLGMVCAKESNHWDCCHNHSKSQCN